MGFLENVEGDVVENVAREVGIKKMNKIFFFENFSEKMFALLYFLILNK